MMATQGSRRGIVWAVLGGAVLLAGIVAIVISSLMNAGQPASTPTSSNGSAGPSPSRPGETVEFVDGSVVERGWTPEPITTDPDTYIRAALEAASTFDTTLSTREEWLAFLDGWFTPDTRYTGAADQDAALEASRTEMRQGVVLPLEQWESLAREDGRVVAAVTGEVTSLGVAEDASGDMTIGTADITLTFTRDDDSGMQSSYEESVRVSVQVLCGAASVPTPRTAQAAGDCKVVRYFTEPMEP